MGNKRWLRNSLVYLLIILGVIVIFFTLIPTFGDSNELALTEVIAMAKSQEIAEIIVDDEKLTVIPHITGGAGDVQFTSYIGRETDLMSVLADNGVEIGTDSDPADGWTTKLNTKKISAGTHTLTVQAEDNIGQLSVAASSAIEVTAGGGGGGGGNNGGGGGGGNNGGGGGGPKCNPHRGDICPES